MTCRWVPSCRRHNWRMSFLYVTYEIDYWLMSICDVTYESNDWRVSFRDVTYETGLVSELLWRHSCPLRWLTGGAGDYEYPWRITKTPAGGGGGWSLAGAPGSCWGPCFCCFWSERPGELAEREREDWLYPQMAGKWLPFWCSSRMLWCFKDLKLSKIKRKRKKKKKLSLED